MTQKWFLLTTCLQKCCFFANWSFWPIGHNFRQKCHKSPKRVVFAVIFGSYWFSKGFEFFYFEKNRIPPNTPPPRAGNYLGGVLVTGCHIHAHTHIYAHTYMYTHTQFFLRKEYVTERHRLKGQPVEDPGPREPGLPEEHRTAPAHHPEAAGEGADGVPKPRRPGQCKVAGLCEKVAFPQCLIFFIVSVIIFYFFHLFY